MPAQHRPARRGLAKGTGRGGIPHPGEGGYDYPRGPFGATGFPGSTPAALGRISHSQTVEGRRDRQLTATAAQARDTNPTYISPSGQPWNPKARNQPLATGYEHRAVPEIGNIGLVFKPPRNTRAQRWKAIPGVLREYRPAPNPGLTGAHLTGRSQYHPGTQIYGDPDGKPIPGMASNPGNTLPEVAVISRYVSRPEDGWAQEGYAMNRVMLFSKGGTPPAIPRHADPHIRGGRLSGQRYFGAIADQQRIGQPSDSYGIARRRGPRHRPVRFEQPSPWSANYRDIAPPEGDQNPDMIHQSPAGAPRRSEARRARQGPRRTGRR